MLPRIDSVPLDYIEANDEMKKWMANLTDQLNAILEQLDADLAAIDARLTLCGC